VRLAAILVLGSCAVQAVALEYGGQLRADYSDRADTARGPVALANAVEPERVATFASGPTLQTELRASGRGVTGIATLQQQRLEGDRWRSTAWVNELYASGGGGAWQFSAGKRIVAWDVGYGFRPNDVVEQEVRRTLLATTPEGRPLLMAERFDASTAWSIVLVNPTKPHAERGAEEPALALRVYQRDGAVDWHGFARWGAHTRGSVGAAAAWVASEATELHASVRWLDSADSRAIDSAAVAAAPAGLVRTDPWVEARIHPSTQALLGGTWTNAEQLSLLAEAWWDGTALSNGQWDGWNRRNRQLAALGGTPAPLGAIAGNLAWQAQAFDAGTSLRRLNLFVRASWTLDKWQPAVDMLYTPADAGRVVTASLGWQGDRVRVDGGARLYGGPSDAVLAQLPTRRLAYLAVTWAF
jgi:hypothetical protein